MAKAANMIKKAYSTSTTIPNATLNGSAIFIL